MTRSRRFDNGIAHCRARLLLALILIPSPLPLTPSKIILQSADKIDARFHLLTDEFEGRTAVDTIIPYSG